MRAHEREATWAPRYVANELAGTHQAADRARQDVQLRRAEAAMAPDEEDRTRLQREGDDAEALAQTLAERAQSLAEVDDARARWLAHTAGSRAAAERAKAEIAARHADDTDVEPDVTAEEWLAAHRAAVAEDEQHRDVTELDVTDEPADRDVSVEYESPRATGDNVGEPVEVVPADEPDIREVAAEEPAPTQEDDVRVPPAEETADAVSRARRALAEIQARDEADTREEAAHRDEQLTQWQEADATADVSESVDDGADVEYDDATA